MIQIASVTLVHGMLTIQRAVVPLMLVISLLQKTVLNAEAQEHVLMELSIVGIQLVITVSGMNNIQKLVEIMMMMISKLMSFAALVQTQP